MIKYIALFRGINVGGNNVIPMSELKELLSKCNFEDVKTYIQSGNVVFSTAITDWKIIERKIKQAVEAKNNFKPDVIVIDSNKLEKMIEENPFPCDNGKLLHFFILKSSPDNPDLQELESLKTNGEEFLLLKDIFYLYAPNGIGRSKLASSIEKSLGVSLTARNWNTINKLSSMVNE